MVVRLAYVSALIVLGGCDTAADVVQQAIPEWGRDARLPDQPTHVAGSASAAAPSGAASDSADASATDLTAPVLTYAFEQDQYYGYEITIEIDSPDITESHRAYSLYRVLQADDDQIALVHYGHQDVDRETKPGASLLDGGGYQRVTRPAVMLLDRHGELLRIDEITPLPHVLGELETVALPTLSPQPLRRWSTEDRYRIGESRGPAPSASWGGGSSEAHEQVTCSVASVKGDVVWIDREHEVRSDDSYSNLGDFHLKGTGRFSFDRRRGRVASMSMKYVLVSKESGKSESVTASLDCRPMSEAKLQSLAAKQEKHRQEEIARVQRETAEEDAREASRSGGATAHAAPVGQADPDDHYRTWSDASGRFNVEAKLLAVDGVQATLRRRDGRTVSVPIERLAPADRAYALSAADSATSPSPTPQNGGVITVSGTAYDSEPLGGSGGFDFRFSESAPLLGLRYRLGSWQGQEAVGKLEPIFRRGASSSPDQQVMARPGYAVGGLLVDADQYVNAIQVIFMRQNADGTLDTVDRYHSPWLGKPTGKPPTLIGGSGDPVVGIHGRAGLVTDAVGLVLQK